MAILYQMKQNNIIGGLTDEQLALLLATQNTEINQLKLANDYYQWLLSKKETNGRDKTEKQAEHTGNPSI